LFATAKGTLGGARPFALQVDGTLRSNFQDKPLVATLERPVRSSASWRLGN